MNQTRRNFIKTTSLGITISTFALPKSHGQSGKRPNIILCMADDQGWGDMGYNGHPKLQTPNFDRMARESLRFDRFYAAAPVCTPTRGSVLTGRHPNRFGCFQWGHPIRPQETTIAEALNTKGYVTGHFGKWHVGSVQNGSPTNPAANGFDEWVSAPNFFDNDPILSREGVAEPMEGESSVLTAELAIEFIRKHAKSDQPFFAVVWFGSPHNPHEAVEEDKQHYQDENEQFQNFYGEITGMDRAFGKLRDEIKTLGIKENTMLWYCSDNGGLRNLGETGGRAHKGEVYEGGLRVPAMLEYPPLIKDPRQTALPCNTVDIYPTILDMLDIEIERQAPLDGVSLLPLLEDDMDERPPMGFWDYSIRGISTPSKKWMQELYDAQQAGSRYSTLERLRLDAASTKKQYPTDSFPGHSAWLDYPWKLHRIENGEGEITWELYNLNVDPMESTNLIEDHKERVESMKTALHAWLTSVVNSLNGKDYS